MTFPFVLCFDSILNVNFASKQNILLRQSSQDVRLTDDPRRLKRQSLCVKLWVFSGFNSIKGKRRH